MLRFLSLAASSIVYWALADGVAAQDTDQTNNAESFDQRIAPLLVSYCLDCHSGFEPKGGLDLSRRESTMQGGDSGAAIDSANPEQSLFWNRIASGEMPPEEALPDAAKVTFRQWIAAGAAWGTDPIDPFRVTTSKRAGTNWWSLQPISHPDPPQVEAQDRVRNPIDAFVLAKLEEKGLTFSADTDPRTLVRRTKSAGSQWEIR